MSGSSGRPDRPKSGQDVLELALRYALTAAEQVTPEMMQRPTPCRGWNLRMLLLHATESLCALAEGFDSGHIRRYKDCYDPEIAADPAAAFRGRARVLLDSCTRADRVDGAVTIGGCPMGTGLLATAGALEVAMHGWDIAQTCCARPPIPERLAIELLGAAPLLISPADRDLLFAAPVPVAAGASPSDQLAAFLGRSVH